MIERNKKARFVEMMEAGLDREKIRRKAKTAASSILLIIEVFIV